MGQRGNLKEIVGQRGNLKYFFNAGVPYNFSQPKKEQREIVRRSKREAGQSKNYFWSRGRYRHRIYHTSHRRYQEQQEISRATGYIIQVTGDILKHRRCQSNRRYQQDMYPYVTGDILSHRRCIIRVYLCRSIQEPYTYRVAHCHFI